MRRVQMRDCQCVSARSMQSGMNWPFYRRSFRARNRLSFQVCRDHLLRAQIALVRAHTWGNKHSFCFGLVDADMAKDADHALHCEDASTQGKLLTQILLRTHCAILLCVPSNSFTTSPTSCSESKRSGGTLSLSCSGILMSYSRKFLMPSCVGNPG